MNKTMLIGILLIVCFVTIIPGLILLFDAIALRDYPESTLAGLLNEMKN